MSAKERIELEVRLDQLEREVKQLRREMDVIETKDREHEVFDKVRPMFPPLEKSEG